MENTKKYRIFCDMDGVLTDFNKRFKELPDNTLSMMPTEYESKYGRDANMGVLDTYIEPVKGLEILIHRTTVLKTGAIATGQFR